MRTSMIALSALLLLSPAPAPQERPQPPKGWFCSNEPKTPKDHKCDCHRTCVKQPDDEQGDGAITIVEDPKCKVYCHKDHCGCPVDCGKRPT